MSTADAPARPGAPGVAARRARLLAGLWRHPAAVLLPVAVTAGAVAGAMQYDGDEIRFRQAGATLLGPDGLDVFSDSFLQIGPLYLLALGLLTRAATVLGMDDTSLAVLSGALHGAVLTGVALVTAARAARTTGQCPRTASWAVAGGLLATGHVGANLFMQHPEEILLGLLVALAAVEVTAGRRTVAALLVVAATGVKQWAVTAGGVLVHRSVRATAASVLVVAAGLAVVYGPFLGWGDVRTDEIVWRYSPYSWAAAVPQVEQVSGWTLRVVQGGVAGLAGVLVTWRRWGSPLLAALVAVDVRLLVDPLRHSYYAGALAAVLLVWLWSAPVPRRARLVVTALLVVPTFAPIVPTAGWWHLGTLVLLVLPWWCLRVERAARDVSRSCQQAVTS